MMRLVLVCAAIVSVCRGAAVPVTTTKPVLINYNDPQFIVTSKGGNNETGRREFISLYKDGKLTKLLEPGTAVAYVRPCGRYTYLGSRDGIYRYDDSNGKVERYGTLHDDINGIVKETHTEDLYILNEDRAVYKVTDGGTKKAEIPEAKGAHEIELDWDDNLYYYKDDYQPYVVTSEGVKKIEGLPTISYKGSFQKTITKTPGITFRFNDPTNTYVLYQNGTSELYLPTAKQRALIKSAMQESRALLHLVMQLDTGNNV